MTQNELPSGIERLLTDLSYSCSEPGHAKLRQDMLRKWVGEVADSHRNGWQLLRDGARAQLASEDAAMLIRAISILFVVGKSTDALAVEPLLCHVQETVRTAARTCLFEIRWRMD